MANNLTFPSQLQENCSNDPFGNFVVIPARAQDLEGVPVSMESVYEAAMEVISDPVFILVMEDEEISYYYYRRFEGSGNMLLGAKKHEDHFLVSIYQKDPSQAQLSVLYKKARQIH